MLALIQYHLVTLVVALLIGVATGWWVFRSRTTPSPDRSYEVSSES